MEEDGKERSEEGVEKGEENTQKVVKKHKKRQKKLLTDLQKQIEFYFSEPNLQKDRFLRQEISESKNGCVKIETIASFNRMKQLCGDISLIIKAMKICPSIEVIDDKWVKPSKPLSEPKNVDPMTIYVERLPSNADHDWVKSMFSSCGKVVYVSLPRYKSTRDIKRFAFVEFEKESEAKVALEMFAEKPNTVEEVETENKTETNEEHAGKQNKKNKKRKAKISESENEDTKTKSKKTKRKREDGSSTSSIPDTNFGTDKDETKKNKRNIEKEDFDQNSHKRAKKHEEDEKELSGSDETSEKTKSRKRKRERSEANEDTSASSKKIEESRESDEGCTSSKKSKDACETSAQDGMGEVGDEDVEDKKRKKRKRKKKEKEKQEVEAPQLRVISKTEWLSLKKEYQKLQREAMKDAKAKLKIEFDAKTEQASKVDEKSEEMKPDNTDDVEIKTGSTEKKEPVQELEMQPGVVLRFSTEENIDKRQLRKIFSTIAPVAYLEKDDDKNMGHVRFETKEACDKVVGSFSTSSVENIKIEILTEKEDAEYWERLNKDRLERCQGTKRNRNKRGRQKITKKMDERAARKQDHIHFDE